MRKTALVFMVLLAGTVLSACGGGSGGGGGTTGGGQPGGGTPVKSIIGRWDAVMTTGDLVGDFGLLISSETATTANGSTSDGPFAGTISGTTLQLTWPDGSNSVVFSLPIGSSVMSGTATSSKAGSTPVPFTFDMKSSTSTDPYIGGPKVVSAAIVKMPSLNEYAVVVSWDRPVGGGYWNFSIVQGANTILADTFADRTNFTYNPTTYSYTMPFLATAGLNAGACTLSLEEPGWNGGRTWRDPYGVQAWSTAAQVYTANLVVP